MDCSQVLPNLFLGSYPACVEDISRLQHEFGITAVVAVQTTDDFAYLNVDWDRLQARYRRGGVELRWMPVRDFDLDDLCENLPACVQALDELVRAGHRVYVHCTMGMGRSPSVVIAYLHWVQGWDFDKAVEHVTRCRPCMPGLEAIRRARGGGRGTGDAGDRV